MTQNGGLQKETICIEKNRIHFFFFKASFVEWIEQQQIADSSTSPGGDGQPSSFLKKTLPFIIPVFLSTKH